MSSNLHFQIDFTIESSKLKNGDWMSQNAQLKKKPERKHDKKREKESINNKNINKKIGQADAFQ